MEDNFLDRPFQALKDTDLNVAFEGIFSTFIKLVPTLPSSFFDYFRKVTFPVSFKPHQIIVDYGDICKHCYFMLTGLVRSTKILKSRGETTVWFIREGDILFAVDSFYTQMSSDEKLTALKDTFCIALPWSELQTIYSKFLEFNIVGRLLTEQYYRQALERSTWFYESPETRYEHVIQDYPMVAEHVSVKELASYLGIARETLSRLRRRISRKRKSAKK